MTDEQKELVDALVDTPLFQYMDGNGWLELVGEQFRLKSALRGDIRLLVGENEYIFYHLTFDGFAVCDDPDGFYSVVAVDWRHVTAVMKVMRI